MNTRLVNTAADVILAAQTQNRTAAGIALALESAQMLMGPETAAELERLRKRVAELDAGLPAMQEALLKALDRVAELEAAAYGDTEVRLLDPIGQLKHLHAALAAQLARAGTLDRLLREAQAQQEALAARLRKGQTWQPGRNPELVTQDHVSQDELRAIFGIALTAPWENEAAPKCRCSEPDADPYACEAVDCEGEFSELNPFGGAPVEGRDAKVSKVCGCGWRTSVWHVDDGSAEAELHEHVVRVHGGTHPTEAGGR